MSEGVNGKIGIVGLGYVGLPLMLGYSDKGFSVLGFDIDQSKIDTLLDGESYIQHIGSKSIRDGLERGLIDVTCDFSRVAELDSVIICVPTPLSKHHEPDLSYVIATVDSIAPHLKAGQAVSLESTTYPGTTDEVVRPRIEAQGFEIGKSIFLVYSPEREDPGNKRFAGTSIPKLVGGSTASCLEKGLSLYGAIFQKIIPVSSTRVAEFAKLLENIYRAVNIGLVNELKTVADEMGIDIWEVIEAASSKPFGFTPFYPGPGLGGHCIPIDPFYLTWKAREYGIHTRFVELAGEVNEGMPLYVVRRVAMALNDRKKPVNGCRILVMGLAYKSNVDDMRESPAFALMDLLSARGASVDYFDPHISEIAPTREHSNWAGKKSIEWKKKTVCGYDCAVIATKHDRFSLSELVEWVDCIVDTRNALDGVDSRPAQVTKA